jgi:hypothetical protein
VIFQSTKTKQFFLFWNLIKTWDVTDSYSNFDKNSIGQPRILTLGQSHFFLKFRKPIYHSLARGLRTLTYGVNSWVTYPSACHFIGTNNCISTRLPLALTSPYNIYYKAVVAYKFFQVGYTLLCLLLVLAASSVIPFSEVLKCFSLYISLHSVPFGCISDKWPDLFTFACLVLDILSHNVRAPCNSSITSCYCLSPLSSSSSSLFWVSLRLGNLLLHFL